MKGGTEYRYTSGVASHTAPYLWPTVLRVLERELAGIEGKRLFELGCGNGAFALWVGDKGYDVAGVDTSVSGIKQAKLSAPSLDLHVGSSDDDLVAKFGRFPAVVSLEVIEHIYAPRLFASRLYDLLDIGGLAIISTPYHGYWKNLALALTGRMDAHFTALWDCGHIKFWSISTLRDLLSQTGFREINFVRVGRVPPLAKSMIAIARK